jgi:predicted nucleotidyltransferase
VLFAYIFGSFAQGTAGPLSDLDVAVYVDETLIPEDLPFGYKSELLAEIMSCLKRNDVDLVILNQAPTLLRFQVLRSGKLIYCRSPRARVRFAEEVFRDYQDLRPLLDVQRYYLKKRLQEGKFGVGKDG